MVKALEARGDKTVILARNKDVTCSLLDNYGFSYEVTGMAGRKSRFGQLKELVSRDLSIYKLARRFRPDLILTRNPAGVQAARLVGATGVFDTDDGLAAGIHFKAAAPFAHVITTPDCLREDYGPRHVKYPGYKQSAYLHPDHFTPDPEVLRLLDVKPGETFFLVRFVAMAASHDKGESGLDYETKAEIINRLQSRGKVFITTEGEMPEEWKHLQVRIPSHRIHDALAFATLQVGDSQTMAAEAAYLGTPSLRASTFFNRISYLNELEHKFGLTFAFHPSQGARLLDKLDKLLAADDLKGQFLEARKNLLAEKQDIARWYVAHLETWARPAT